ncbi:hypothetical protein [Streptomyces mirabilis]|uniref:hypothetical protein n=1 Tax=Streptomyces mirabilis TaxID=68239 RepID=UPI00380872D8
MRPEYLLPAPAGIPADFPASGRVYAFFRRWRERRLIAEFHDRLRGKVREREGRKAEPTAGIIERGISFGHRHGVG